MRSAFAELRSLNDAGVFPWAGLRRGCRCSLRCGRNFEGCRRTCRRAARRHAERAWRGTRRRHGLRWCSVHCTELLRERLRRAPGTTDRRSHCSIGCGGGPVSTERVGRFWCLRCSSKRCTRAVQRAQELRQPATGGTRTRGRRRRRCRTERLPLVSSEARS